MTEKQVSAYMVCACGNGAFVLVDGQPKCMICYGKLRNNDYYVEMGTALFGPPKVKDPQERYDRLQ